MNTVAERRRQDDSLNFKRGPVFNRVASRVGGAAMAMMILGGCVGGDPTVTPEGSFPTPSVPVVFTPGVTTEPRPAAPGPEATPTGIPASATAVPEANLYGGGGVQVIFEPEETPFFNEQEFARKCSEVVSPSGVLYQIRRNDAAHLGLCLADDAGKTLDSITAAAVQGILDIPTAEEAENWFNSLREADPQGRPILPEMRLTKKGDGEDGGTHLVWTTERNVDLSNVFLDVFDNRAVNSVLNSGILDAGGTELELERRQEDGMGNLVYRVVLPTKENAGDNPDFVSIFVNQMLLQDVIHQKVGWENGQPDPSGNPDKGFVFETLGSILGHSRKMVEDNPQSFCTPTVTPPVGKIEWQSIWKDFPGAQLCNR